MLLSFFQLSRVWIILFLFLFSFKLIGAPQTMICSSGVYQVKLNYIMNIYFALAFISLNPQVILVVFILFLYLVLFFKVYQILA